MIEKKELKEYAKLKLLNLGNTEKDYLIDIALMSISRHIKNELIFKGGTCLYKFHKLNRFSEDINFSSIKEIKIGKLMNSIIKDFEKFGIKVLQHKKKEPFNSILITAKIKGPLCTGNPSSYASLGIDINFKSIVILAPETLSFKSIYPEIPTFSVLCMQKEEIFAEKIRAILTRKRARDLFDLYFLLNQGIHSNKELIEKKMEYYNEKFELKKLILNIKLLKGHWAKELQGFTTNLPNFDEVNKKVSNQLSKLY